jgi:Uma2 family endonuclease
MDRETLTAQPPLVLPDSTWDEYVAIDAAFGSRRGARIRFLQGYLELMLPTSLEHERWKSHLGRLVEAWCLDRGIDFFIHGETTLLREGEAGGAPDESYAFGTEKEIPDLVIEIALTSGGISKKSFYQRFAIPELWIWRQEDLEVYRWNSAIAGYERTQTSAVLPGLPLPDLIACARISGASQAIREFRRRIGMTGDA